MPRPNIMWLWSAITLVIVGYWIFSSDEVEPVKSDWAAVEQMVESGAVQRIMVVNREEARVMLKEGKADSLRNVDLRYKNIPKSGYQFFFNIGSVDSFKSDLENLKKTINDCYIGEMSEVKSLKEQVRDLADLNNTIGREAKELTLALKGNSKVQGDWGEMLLKQLLEKSGLEEGVNYVLQATENEDGTKIKGENGGQLRPDAIFYLPEGKNLIIDSKVSLTAYTDYINASAEEQPAMLASHLRSVKSHIDELARKEYPKHVKNSADFVMMFVPNEGAYMAALNADKELWESAYNRHVVIISPTHLISVLKLMYQLWMRDKQTKNALNIAAETGKLYDKFVGFVADLEEINRHLGKASSAYELAYNKLSTGRGNIISKIEGIRELGVPTTKRLKIEIEKDENEM